MKWSTPFHWHRLLIPNSPCNSVSGHLNKGKNKLLSTNDEINCTSHSPLTFPRVFKVAKGTVTPGRLVLVIRTRVLLEQAQRGQHLYRARSLTIILPEPQANRAETSKFVIVLFVVAFRLASRAFFQQNRIYTVLEPP